MVAIGFLKNVFYPLNAQILIEQFVKILNHIHLLVKNANGMKVKKNVKE